ncbi:MAG: glycosyltransferase [Cyanobacteriota bacterium]|nr:glycosyltransferase [Cyanobacteriota bacterium]
MISGLSRRLNRRALADTQAIQRRVLPSRTTRILQLYQQQLTPANPAMAVADPGIDELAYAIPHYDFLRQAPALQEASELCRQKLQLPLFACLYWLNNPSLQIRYPLGLRRPAFVRWWRTQAPPHLLEADRQLEAHGRELIPPEQRTFKPFGVNLIGHAFNVFGLGEYVRMMARALEAAEIPYVVVNVPVANGSSDHDRLLAEKILPDDQPLPYAFNLFCMTADSHLQQVVLHRRAADAGITSIATWFWEMEEWPVQLTNSLDLADEYWPCTAIIRQALDSARQRRTRAGISSNDTPPIVPMPVVMDLGGGSELQALAERRQQTRADYGLDPEAVIFSFVFDLNSTIARKNPQAVLSSFQRAFAGSGEAAARVGLLIKTFPPHTPEPLWESLKQAAANDPRITIVEADLDRRSLLALFACCDVFVSLHRSEGLGMGLTEALQLGLDVIATDYGGNTDFCTGPLAHPIPYRLIPVQPGEYPHHQGMVWADPDLEAATAAMRHVAQLRRDRGPTPEAVQEHYRQQFSAARAGAAYRRRLEQLWQQRQAIQAE